MKKELRAQWASAGYGRFMGSAEVSPPPHQEFVRLYHLTSAEFGVSDIGLSRLKVARFSDLNDPFELISVNLRETRVRQVIRKFKDAYGSRTGLLCFSANWTNPVLWSHYGDRHRGICLGFDLKRGREQKVEYKDSRLLSKLSDDENPLALNSNLQELLVRTKYRHWEYEEESRVFVPLGEAIQEGNMHFCSFDNNLQLAEVILGPQSNMSLDAVRELVSARHPQAMTFKARLAFKTFDVVPDERTVPD